jgi:hypothetical protein
LDMKQVFDTTWHPGLLYKLAEFQFLTTLIKPINPFLWNKIQNIGWKLYVGIKKSTSGGGTKFHPVPGLVQSFL